MNKNVVSQEIIENRDDQLIFQFKLKNLEKSGAIKLSAQQIAERFQHSFGAMISLGDIQLLRVDFIEQIEAIIQSVYEDKASSKNKFKDVPFLDNIIKYNKLIQDEDEEEQLFDNSELGPGSGVDSKFQQIKNAIEMLFEFTKDIDQVKKVELEEKFKALIGGQLKKDAKIQTNLLIQCKKTSLPNIHQSKLFLTKEEKEPAYIDLLNSKPFKNPDLEQQLQSRIFEIESFAFGVLQFDNKNIFSNYFKSEKILTFISIKSKIVLKENPQNERILSILVVIQHQFILKFDIDLSLCRAIYEEGQKLYFRLLSPPAFYANLSGRQRYESNQVKSSFVRVDNVILNHLYYSEQITEIQRLMLLNCTTIQINFESNIDFLKSKFATYHLLQPQKVQINQINLQKDISYNRLLQSKYLDFATQFNILAAVSQNKISNQDSIITLIRFCESEIKKMSQTDSQQQISGIFELAFNQFFKVTSSIQDKDIERKNNIHLKIFSKMLERANEDYIIFKDPEMRLAFIRRISLTPSGLLYFSRQPEVTSGILRTQFKILDSFLRVHFEDENQDLVLNIPYVTQCFYSKLVFPYIPILNAQYQLFTWSSSSLRAGTCWFINYNTANKSRKEIITSIGNFTNLKTEEIAKNAARLGQNLSSSFSVTFEGPLNITISEDQVDKHKKLYTDGIGMISLDLINELRQKIKISKKYHISAIQVRYEGAKGLLVLNQSLPDKTIILRRSMIKYNPRKQGYPNTLQVLDYNKFRAGYLNRQIIILLLTLNVKETFFQELQNEYLKKIESLTMKDSSIYKYFSIDYNNEQLGAPNIIEAISAYINIGMENNLLCQGILARLKQRGLLQLRKKSTILVEKAARVLGVIDEHKLLQEGEVYCSVQDENDKSQAEPFNVEGEVVVTRNPCLHPGDIKRLIAISHQLIITRSGGSNPYQELVNCIVFPSVGNSVPCQIAGGDLDGDLYFLSWDERLLPPKQQKPMIYDAVKPKQNIKTRFTQNNSDLHENNTDKCFDIKNMLDFLFMYLNSDVLGKIDNSHLAWADKSEKLANDQNCLDLAELHSEAVDFVKHGRPVQVEQKLICKIFPDYMEKDSQAYESQIILGKLYRDIVAIGGNQENSFNLGYNQKNLVMLEIRFLYKFQDLVANAQKIKNDIIVGFVLKTQDQQDQDEKIVQVDEELSIEIENLVIGYIDQNYKKLIVSSLKLIQYIFEAFYGMMNTFQIKNEFEIYSGNFTNFTSGDGLYFRRRLNIEKFQKRVIAQLVELKQQIDATFQDLNQTEKLQQISLMNFILSYSPESHPYPRNTLIGQFIEKMISLLSTCDKWKQLTGQVTLWHRGAIQYFFWKELIEIYKDSEDDLI